MDLLKILDEKGPCPISEDNSISIPKRHYQVDSFLTIYKVTRYFAIPQLHRENDSFNIFVS
jgi:hypothetical protein